MWETADDPGRNPKTPSGRKRRRCTHCAARAIARDCPTAGKVASPAGAPPAGDLIFWKSLRERNSTHGNRGTDYGPDFQGCEKWKRPGDGRTTSDQRAG